MCSSIGIYPREPRNKKKASRSSTPSTTFYYTKDIQYLLHEPLLNKFRDHKALAKKIAKSLGRGEVGDAARLERNNNPKLSLDHIIKERYPTFVDALRDLDDALSMLVVFANLPATSTVPPKTVALCQRLCHEFEHYLISTHSLRKSFLSIKGIYYQATIQGQDIIWLVPYKFVQRVTGDVDFRIMGTFVEFYTTLLGFVNFRLYTSIGLVYPPRFNVKSDEKGGELNAFVLEGKGVDEPTSIEAVQTDQAAEPNPDIQGRIDAMDLPTNDPSSTPDQQPDPSDGDHEASDTNATVDTFTPIAPDADVLPQPSQPTSDLALLFAPLSLFLSRETPRHPLEFLLRAFGCKRISWDAVLGDGAYTHNEFDPSITHQVVDRPPLAPVNGNGNEIPDAAKTGGRMPGRTYIQPQWVWDCVNEGRLLRPDLYAPGATLPPHLSPWVKPTKGAYDPSAPLAEQEREGEAQEALLQAEMDGEEDGDEAIEGEVDQASAGAVDIGEGEELNNHGMPVTTGDSSDEASELFDKAEAASSFGGFSDQDDLFSDADSDSSATRHQRELEAEAAGLNFTEAKPVLPKSILKNSNQTEADMKKRKALARGRREEEEELERRKMMMGRKKRKMVDKMLFSNARKDEAAEKLRAKRRKLEKGKGAL